MDKTTHARRHPLEILETQERFGSAQNSLPTTVWTTDIQLNICSCAQAHAENFYSPGAGIVGHSINTLVSQHKPGMTPEAAHRLALKGQWISSEMRIGDAICHTTIGPQHDIDGKVIGCTGVAVNTESSYGNASNHSWHQANHDALTGLPGRALFMDRLGNGIHLAKRMSQLVALLYVNLDLFHWINDNLGETSGDELLVETARRITSLVRESDTVSRISGDEFAILLPSISSKEDAVLIATNILSGLSRSFTVSSGETCTLAASIGISLFPELADSTDKLMHTAHAAMHWTKQHGRNRHTLFQPNMNRTTRRKMNIAQELRQSVDNGDFALHYQPIIDFSSGTVSAGEALVRWQHPTHGLLMPDEFINLAEDTGLIRPLGEWILQTAINDMKNWNTNEANPLTIAVNLSLHQCQNSIGISRLKSILEDNPVGQGLIDIEITESLALENSAPTIGFLKQLANFGLTLTIDDFGTGYSSLGYLRTLPVSVVKIDRSFITSITKSPNDARFISAIIELAHSLDIRVVAEGIESHEQLELLNKLGCDYGQGFFFSKAVPAANFLATSRDITSMGKRYLTAATR